MKTADLLWKLLGILLKPIAKAFGEDPEEARKELVKRITVTDTAAEDKEKELEAEMP